MRKYLICFTLVFSLIIISTINAGAGEGAVTWYGAHFNDWIDSGPSNAHNLNNYINVSNFNNYSSTFNITYYKADGTKFTGSSGATSFTHSVNPKGRVAVRPSVDLNLDSTTALKGSFVIKCTKGQVSPDCTFFVLAGQNLANIIGSDYYNVNDPLFSMSVPLSTKGSSYLTKYFVHYDVDGDNLALKPQDGSMSSGEMATWFGINNPSDDTDAIIKMTFYDRDGNIFSLTTAPSGEELINNNTTVKIILGPHQYIGRNPGLYGLGVNTVAKGTVVIDVENGSILANYYMYFANKTTKTPYFITYEGFGGPLRARQSE